jgi:hypothetical protein
MATDQDFDEYTVEVVHKPVGGVELGEIPEKLAQLLSAHVGTLTREDGSFDPDREMVIRAQDEKQGKRLLGYARAWGARQTPKLRVTKVPNGKRYDDRTVRLNVQKDEEVDPNHRPGRKPGK